MHGRAAGLLTVLVMAGCHSGDAPSPTPPPSSAVISAPGTVPCEDVIGTVAAPDRDLTVIDDAVALPAAAPLQASAMTITVGAALFAKSGLVVRRQARVRLRVLAPAAGRAWIGWGSPAEPGQQAAVDGCDSAGAWLAFAGGFWVRKAMCVPVGVRVAGGVEHRVDIAVGTPCPGS